MSKSLLIISRQSPWSGPSAREALDIALAGGAFDLPIGMLFLDDGVFQLSSAQQPASLQQKDLGANLQALPMFGVEALYVAQRSLAERGLQPRLQLARDRNKPLDPALTSIVVRAALYRGGATPPTEAGRRAKCIGRPQDLTHFKLPNAQRHKPCRRPRRRGGMGHQDGKAPHQWLRRNPQPSQRAILMANRHGRHKADAHPRPHRFLYPLHASNFQPHAHRHATAGKRAFDNLPHP